MNFNTSNFQLNNKILYATDEEIIFSEEKTELMKTWDSLALHYNNKLEIENENNLTETKLNNILNVIKAEVDTFIVTTNLVDQNIITGTEVKSKKQDFFNFKELMVDSAINILENGLKVIEEADEKMEALDKIIFEGIKAPFSIKDFQLPFKRSNGQLRIYFQNDKYAYLNDNNEIVYPSSWIPKGFLVSLKYKNNVFNIQIIPKTFSNTILNIKEYFRELEVECKLEKDEICFEIKRNTENLYFEFVSSFSTERQKRLCIGLMDLIRKVDKKEFLKDDFFEYIVIYLSNISIQNLIMTLKQYELISLSGDCLIDGYPKEFVLASDRIYKFIRDKKEFKYFVNEERTATDF